MATSPLTKEEQEQVSALIPTCDFKGVKFKDISPLLYDYKVLKMCCDKLTEAFKDKDIGAVAGLEARGFLFGPLVAMDLGVGFIPLRKPGKLPGNIISEEYEKEYGTDSISMQSDILKKGTKVLIVDDLLATGGTLVAACNLIKKAGGVPVACALVVELTFLPGRKKVLDETDCKEIVALIDF